MITIKVKECGCEKSFDENKYPEYYEWVKTHGTKCAVSYPRIDFGNGECQLCPWRSEPNNVCICKHNRSIYARIEIVQSCMKLFD